MLGGLKTMECKGKSKFFVEHQAMREKEGNKGYDPSVHSWRFKEQVPLPEGKYPPLWKFPQSVLDEHAKEELAQLKREENQNIDELAHRYRWLQKEVKQRREQFPSGKAPSDKELRKEVAREERLAKANERHVKNVQMAVRVINRRYPDRKYELKEITAKSTIYEMGSAYCHYNFTVYSPTDGSEFYFAELDIDPVYEFHVYQCCRLGSGPYGYCKGCLKEAGDLIHPSIDNFIAGHEDFGGFCTDSDSDDDIYVY